MVRFKRVEQVAHLLHTEQKIQTTYKNPQNVDFRKKMQETYPPSP